MKVFYLFFTLLFILSTFTKAMDRPMYSFLIGARKSPGQTSISTVKKQPSFNDPKPNIPKHTPANAHFVLEPLPNQKFHVGHIQHEKQVAVKQEAEHRKKLNIDGVAANQRTQTYLKHNENEIHKANRIGGKIAISRSESGRNNVYHAINPQ